MSLFYSVYCKVGHPSSILSTWKIPQEHFLGFPKCFEADNEEEPLEVWIDPSKHNTNAKQTTFRINIWTLQFHVSAEVEKGKFTTTTRVWVIII